MNRRAIISKVRKRFQRRLPLNITAVKRDDPELLQAAFSVTPFLGWRQALHQTGTDYSRINIELEEFIECPICQVERRSLPPHLLKTHGLTMEQFYAEFPEAPSISETMMANRMNHSNAATRVCPHWEPLWSPEYALDRLFYLHCEGYPINYGFLEEQEGRLLTRTIEYFGHLDHAYVRLGLDPREVRVRIYWTHEEIERKIREIVSAEDFPGIRYLASILVEHHAGFYNACLREFGSLDNTVRALGISTERTSRVFGKRRKKPMPARKGMRRTKQEMPRKQRTR